VKNDSLFYSLFAGNLLLVPRLSQAKVYRERNDLCSMTDQFWTPPIPTPDIEPGLFSCGDRIPASGSCPLVIILV
jgi:hypothetical protein